MVFRLAPVLALFFVGLLESKWLNEYNLNKSKICLRQVDNIPTTFDKEQDSLNLLNVLSRKNPNVKFMIDNL